MEELRVCIYDGGAGERTGSAREDRVFDLNLCCAGQLALEKGVPDPYRLANTMVPSDLGGFIRGGASVLEAARRALAWARGEEGHKGPAGEPLFHSAKDVRLRAPVLPSSKVICLGDVYESHLTVRGSELPDRFGLFYKMSQVVVGPEEWVVIPKHHEGPMVYGTELTLVIGKEGRSIAESAVQDHIWGYTILNDITLRDLHRQLGPTPKVFDTSAPVGPWIVPKDQVVDAANLGLLFRINGRQVQDGTTSDMRFSLDYMVAEVSKWHTLRPGDIIATGDIGATEPVVAGDVMEAEVEGIGVLRNPVKQED